MSELLDRDDFERRLARHDFKSHTVELMRAFRAGYLVGCRLPGADPIDRYDDPDDCWQAVLYFLADKESRKS